MSTLGFKFKNNKNNLNLKYLFAHDLKKEKRSKNV